MVKRRMRLNWRQQFVRDDAERSDRFCRKVNQYISLRALRKPFKVLEYLGHGATWVLLWTVYALLCSSDNTKYSFLSGCVLDTILVYALKGKIKKKRPTACRLDMFMNYGAQFFAMPSAHVSKACYSVLFLKFVYDFRIIPLFIWLFIMSVSRFLLRRVNCFDVLAALLTGTLSFLFTYYFTIGQLNC